MRDTRTADPTAAPTAAPTGAEPTSPTEHAGGHEASGDPDAPLLLPVARTTGALYLALGVTGMLAFLVIRPQVFGDADVVTLAQSEALARVGIAAELGLVTTQALAALWFYRLLRAFGSFAAGAVAAFGLVNAIAILASTASLTTAVRAATQPVGDAAAQVNLLVGLADNFWVVGAVFFGLWLVPMGVLAQRAGMPRLLGWLLVVGGVGYVLNAFVAVLAPGVGAFGELLTVPATVGEFWMIGYLLHGGVFRRAVEVR